MPRMFCLLLLISSFCFAKNFEEPLIQGANFHSPVPYYLKNIVVEEFEMLKKDRRMMMDECIVTKEDQQKIMTVLDNVITDHWHFHHLSTPIATIPGRQSFIQGIIRLHRVMDFGAHIEKLNDLFHKKFFPVFGLDKHVNFEYYRMIFLYHQITQSTEGSQHMERRLKAMEKFLVIDSPNIDMADLFGLTVNINWLTHFVYWSQFEEEMIHFHPSTLKDSKDKLNEMRQRFSR